MALSAVLLAACAHTREEVHTATVTAEPAPSSIEREEREIIAVDTALPAESAPPARPRLSHTVTLGQGAEQQYTPSPPPAQAQAAQSPNVVVNNNVVVQQGAPGYYGYGGNYRYGGYGRPTTFYSNDGRSGYRGTRQWGATGWEGARRTAAPGQTPGVGGNWAPPPSYGPAQMK